MSRKGGHSKNEYTQGFSYVAQKPKFLQNFGKPPSPPPNARAGPSNPRGDGREPLPERPTDGKWAGGSDGEKEEEGSDDEWGDVFGGSEDGPQIVVLKEGRHLSKDEVKRERRRAAGKPSVSPPPKSAAPPDKDPAAQKIKNEAKTKPSIPKPNTHTNKRKLAGTAIADATGEEMVQNGDGPKKKKKSKPAKGLLSFQEADD